jgi:hypothetical protein
MGLSLGGNNNQTVLEITADASGAVKGYKQAEDAQEKLSKNTISLNKSTSDFSNQYVTLGGALGTAAIGLTAAAAAAAGLVAVTLKLAERGEVYGSLKDAFEGLGGSSKTIDEVISRTQGLVTQADALKIANQALVKGFPDLNKNFGDVAALGASLADALGQETAPAIEKLTKAISLGKAGLAAQVGLFIDSKQALRDYAAETGQAVKQLDAFEKKTAIQNALLEAAKAKLAQMGEVTDSVANAQESLTNRMNDALDVIGDAINRNPELTQAMRELSDAIANIDWVGFAKDVSSAVSVIVNVSTSIKNFTAEVINALPFMRQYRALVSFKEGISNAITEQIPILKEVAKQYKATGIAGLDYSKAADHVATRTANQNEAVAEAGKEAKRLLAIRAELIKKAKDEAAATDKNAHAHDQAGAATKKHKEKVYELLDISKEIADSVLKHKFTPEVENLTAAFNYGLINAEKLTEGLEELRKQFVTSSKEAKDFDAIVSSQDFGKNLGRGKTAVPAPDLSGGEASFSKFLQKYVGSSAENAQIIETALSEALSIGFAAATEYVKTGNDSLAGHYAEAIGGIIGGALGAYFSGGNPAATQLGGQIGSFLGAILDKSLGKLGDEQAQSRKQIEEYVEDFLILYNNIIVQKSGEATPLTNLILGDKGKFAEDLDPLTQSFNEWLDETFKNNPQVTNAFTSVGAALAESLGAGYEEGEKVFASLLQQLGASEDGFNNLKVIVLELGLTLEETTQSIVDLFKKGEIGALDAEGNIQSLNEVFAEGRVGIGDYAGAVDDLIASGGTGIRAIKDLKDIAVEGQEAGIKTLDELKNKLVANGTLSVEQANALFGSIASNGITTLEGLTEVSDRAVISILAGAEAAGFAFGKNFDELTIQLEEAEKALNSTQEAVARIPELQEKRVNFVVTADVDPQAKQIWDSYNGKNGVGVAQ